MYDQDFNLKFEKHIKNLRAKIDILCQRLPGEPDVVLIKGFNVAFYMLYQRKDNYDNCNCFDVEEREKLALEIGGMIQDFESLLDKWRDWPKERVKDHEN